MPLPPNNSRAHATVSRHFAVVKAFASAACASFSFPSACNWAVRTIMHCDAVMFESDQSVLDDFERDFVLNFLNTESRRSLVFNDETFNLVVGDVARPDDRHIAPGRVADPFLLTIENPGIAFAFCGGKKSTGCA